MTGRSRELEGMVLPVLPVFPRLITGGGGFVTGDSFGRTGNLEAA